MTMQTIKNHRAKSAGAVLAILIVAFIVKAQTVPQPEITIALTNTNQISITVTNGVAYGYYSLYNQHVLGSGTWTLISTNDVLGDTNFIINTAPYFEGYYLVAANTNWDDNGIPNWDLADPNNPGLGKLTISIVSPSQGQVLQ
jgi:hypothetical protein